MATVDIVYGLLGVGVVVSVWMVVDIIRIGRRHHRSSNDSDGWPSE